MTTEAVQIQVKGIHFNGRPCILFFTSDARLPAGIDYVLLGAKELFQMMQGQNFVMNPGAAYGKEFGANEITQLLDGTAFLPEQKLTVPNAAQWLITEPADYPTELVAALSRFYATKPQVKRAWIAHYQNAENTEGQGSLIVALDLNHAGALETLAGEGTMLVKSYVHKPKYVDFAQFRNSGPTQYFADKKPFYIKASVARRLLTKIIGG
jgi:hypothetical protein